MKKTHIKNTLINDSWNENLETKIVSNDWYIIPIVLLVAGLIAVPFIIRVINVDSMMAEEVRK
jgi:hypothetical protein